MFDCFLYFYIERERDRERERERGGGGVGGRRERNGHTALQKILGENRKRKSEAEGKRWGGGEIKEDRSLGMDGNEM